MVANEELIIDEPDVRLNTRAASVDGIIKRDGAPAIVMPLPTSRDAVCCAGVEKIASISNRIIEELRFCIFQRTIS